MGNSSWFEGCGLSDRASGKVGLFVSRFTILTAGLTLAFGVLPLKVAAQAAAPSTGAESSVQLKQPLVSGQSTPSITVTLQDALERARKNDPLFLSAISDAKSAHEDRIQARAALLPTISESTQYLGTQGNGTTPNGRYVTNDGVHVYREWGVLHQDVTANTFLKTGSQRGQAVTVTKNYYTLVAAQRRYATAQQALQTAMRFLEISQQSENVGQVA